MQSDFNTILILCSLLVFFFHVLSYGRFELGFITFIPMLISWIWILGIMGITGQSFNIINIIIATFIFGLGDDYSIFIMDGLKHEYTTGKKQLNSHKVAIFLSAVTTVAGIGVLLFAKHPALRSIATITITGMICVLIISYTVEPFLYRLLTMKNNKPKYPATIPTIFITIFAYSYFLLGCLLLTAIGTTLFSLIPFPSLKKRRKLIYHYILCYFTRSLVYIICTVDKKIINPYKEDFTKPAVIVANHQSFLDILALVMLNPKIIMLTNDWVWNSPFFGRVVRLADFYPVSSGAELCLAKFENLIKEGYSIVIFPEGTRSKDGKILRFHKGAFFLAEQLKIDILPVLIHGTGECIKKHELLLRAGHIVVTIGERTRPWEEGKTYSEASKESCRFFRREYTALKENLETPGYYRDMLIKSYIYKGPVLEWHTRIKTRIEKNYENIHALIPQSCRILDLGCGHGCLSLMLSLTGDKREITGVDYDAEKIETAVNVFCRKESLNYEIADLKTYEIKGLFDVIILSHVLHYLPKENQESLLTKCCNALSDGGFIIIRDGDSGKEANHFFTKLTEIFSVKLFAFNKSSTGELYFISQKEIEPLARKINFSFEALPESRYTSNTMFILRKGEL